VFAGARLPSAAASTFLPKERARGPSSVADPGSGAFFKPWMGKKSGSGMNNPDHISESLETIFWVKILEFFDAVPG
jgi:hypothetical protein